MRLLVGLGNPGVKYQNTRHNAGFLLIDQLLEHSGSKWQGKKFDAEWGKARLFGEEFLFLKPQTFMNLSGKSVAQAMRFYKTEASLVIALYDDIDIPFGKVKVRMGGGHGGHNGIRSMIEEISSDNFARVKLGVGRPTEKYPPVADWVLSDFSQSELEQLRGPMFNEAVGRLQSIVQARQE